MAAVAADLPAETVIEVWWQDEARVGQKNGITRRWAELARGHGERSSTGWPAEGKRGTRPTAPKDQRTASAYLFGAICPARGIGAGLALPRCTTAAMQAHLAEISQAVAPGAHAVLLLDQAGWHITPKLAIPDNISLLFLPANCPELNCVENIWQFMRENWLSNIVFNSYEHILTACCEAWNKLIDLPDTITSIGTREWAYRS